MRMSVEKCVVLFVAFLWTSLNKSDALDCVFKQSCILPCSFQPGDEVVIHWIHLKAGNTQVHSYYHNQDQFGRQDQRFKARTSLFKDQISRGNASLRLTGVQVQDQSNYKCYTSTTTGNRETIISVNVEAPVHQVHIQQVENRISCSSEGIYPEPELTWTTNPPSNITLQTKPTVHQTDQQLYNISSSLVVSDLDYSCIVSTGRHQKTATIFKLTSLSGSKTETTIPCVSINTPPKSLIWSFNGSQILTRTSEASTVSEDWKQQVKGVSESGDLTLQDLSPDQEGIYTCELQNKEETYVTNTFLRLEERTDTSNNNGGIIAGVIVCFIAVVGISALIYIRYKTKSKKRISDEKHPKGRELTPLQSTDVGNNTLKSSSISKDLDDCSSKDEGINMTSMHQYEQEDELQDLRRGSTSALET